MGNVSSDITSQGISQLLGCYQPALLTLVSASALAIAEEQSVTDSQHVRFHEGVGVMTIYYVCILILLLC